MDLVNYDGDIQMLIEQPKPVNMEHLKFLRWLAEQGRLEHRVENCSIGAFIAPTPAPAYSGKAS